ncbi:MAG TPA: arylsulfatase [Candidatus Limnocylindrales bacterium]|nr:arylsulfatase [Candidatus Limnocylindrales bacterium]
MTDRGDRRTLPIPDVPPATTDAVDIRQALGVFAPIEPVRPPQGAPNVLVILLDDVGFSATSVFGGPVAMPTAQRLADEGLRYTRFHTTAMCAPTRQAMLTGRNHHSVGMGAITEIATSAPGYSSVRPRSCAPVAEVLKLNGYATAQFGKCHEVPVWQTSPLGPYDAWPTGGGGFQHFYGFLGGETNQYYPSLYEGTTPIEPPATPEEGYHLTEDLADRAISWIRQQQSLQPDAPFFVYFAPGAAHAPHQVPTEWSDRYKGRFDGGWDVLREQILERQKALGIVPPDAELTARHEGIPAWEDTAPELRPVLARQMEVFAGFLEHTDHHIGRVIDALADLGILEDTLVVYILGDNGPSAEGTLQGSFNEMLYMNGAAALETAETMAARIDEFGTPTAYNHYAVGWAHATGTPYQWTKQVASHWGGTRNGTVVSWPNGFKARGELRHQFHHVIDVAPTILEAAGIPEPERVHGIEQRPIEGTSMAYSFDAGDAPERHETQYFEMVGNRGIYHQGWTAVTKHATPWIAQAQLPALDEDRWELYDTRTDWSQAHDLAAEMPEKLAELQALFIEEARKFNVLPLDDRRIERFDARVAGRPVIAAGESQMLYGGVGRLTEATVLSLKNRSHAVTSRVTVSDASGTGVIMAQGGEFGGWALYLVDGRPAYCHNFLGLQRFKVAAGEAVGAGSHEVRMDFAYDGGGLGKGGTVTLSVDGRPVGEGRIGATVPMLFSLDETADIGRDTASPVSDDYTAERSAFPGTVEWVRLDIGDAAQAHEVPAEDRIRIAFARQ